MRTQAAELFFTHLAADEEQEAACDWDHMQGGR